MKSGTLLKLRLACLAVILFVGMTASAQTISIQFDGRAFQVTGWKALDGARQGLGLRFQRVRRSGRCSTPGRHLTPSKATRWSSIQVIPSCSPGMHYRAVFLPPGGGAPVEKIFDAPHQDKIPSVRVEHVYPSGDVLPSNLLRLYIYFSGPMSRSESAQHLRVLDENGKVLRGAQAVFLPGEELWDPNYQRLTMTFDPGRIKRGLTSNMKIGPPIIEGKRYTLVIDRDWPDAHGAPLVESFRKSFRGGPSVRKIRLIPRCGASARPKPVRSTLWWWTSPRR